MDSDTAGCRITQSACDFLLARVGLSEHAGAAALSFTGADPVVRSRLRYGAATAAALGAQGVGIAALWAMRGGARQSVTVDVGRAVNLGLRTTLALRQNGYGFDVGSSSRASNFFRTRDGRSIYLLRNNGRGTITENLIGLLRCENSTEGIAGAVAQWDSHALEEALAARKGFGVVARSREEWLAHPQGAWLAARPGVEVEKIGDAPARLLPDGPRPLSGLRVLDASHVIAGPSAARLLAEQGAEVLHVTNPRERETQQIMMDLGFGKRSAHLDLERPEDLRRMRDLASQADVFIESWRPGVMERRGLGAADLAALRPGIVCLSISCFGSQGPWAARGGYEPIGQAVCGLSQEEGSPHEPRNAPTVTMNDYLAAYLGVAGVMGALVRRTVQGGSYHVTTSLAQASMWVLRQGHVPAGVDIGNVAPYAVAEGDMLRSDTPFGLLEHVAPITRYSGTPGRWDRPSQPFGSSVARW